MFWSVLRSTGFIHRLKPPSDYAFLMFRSFSASALRYDLHKYGKDLLYSFQGHKGFIMFAHLKSADFQDPNPYAAMAIILILSESVSDVQVLVSLLCGCMSLTAIKEYLSHMAMMLLALERNDIQISNR